MNIGIIGYGVVGKAADNTFSKYYNTIKYDKYQDLDDFNFEKIFNKNLNDKIKSYKPDIILISVSILSFESVVQKLLCTKEHIEYIKNTLIVV